MNSGATGLGAAFLIGSAAALPLAAASASESQIIGNASFVAPEGSLMLVRELRRSLARGQKLVTRRTYKIRFERDGDGWLVFGDLVGSEIDAPPELAMLAQIEKTRRDEGLFPIRLDASGMIIEQRGSRDAAASMAARGIIGETTAKILAQPADKAVAADMTHRISAQSAAAGGKWPTDLFRPIAGHRSETQSVPLPDGSSGRVTVTIDAQPAQSGMLRQFERDIITELAGTRRESSEIFRLERAP